MLNYFTLLHYIILDKIRLAYSLLSLLFYFCSSIVFISSFERFFDIVLNLYFILVFFEGKLVDRNVRVKVKCHYFFHREFFTGDILNFLLLPSVITFNDYLC